MQKLLLNDDEIDPRSKVYFPLLGSVGVVRNRIGPLEKFKQFVEVKNTVKPVYNDHPWDPKIVVVVDRWSFFLRSFM